MNDNAENQKAKIRERYKGNITDEVEIIPALPQPKLYGNDQVKRVAAYARVPTIDPKQTHLTSYKKLLCKSHLFIITYSLLRL